MMEGESMTVDALSRCVQKFYRATRANLEKLPDWEACQIDTLLEAIEQYLFSKSHQKYFYCFSTISLIHSALTDDQSQDEMMVDRIENAANDNEKFDGFELYNWDAMLDAEKTPKGKLERIIERIKYLAENGNADELLPKLIFEIMQTKPTHLISNLRYIQRFRNHEQLKGEGAYCMTVMMAVIQHIDGKRQRDIYSLVADSTTTITSSTSLPITPKVSSPSFMARQVNDFNSMASSVFSTIGFVPRAIGAAVVDTIKSRGTKKTADQEKVEFRKKMAESKSFDDLTINDLKFMFADYQSLLSFNNN